MDCQGVQGRARGKATGPEHGRKGALCRALGALPPSAYSGPLAFPPGPSLDPLAVGHSALRLLYVGVCLKEFLQGVLVDGATVPFLIDVHGPKTSNIAPSCCTAHAVVKLRDVQGLMCVKRWHTPLCLSFKVSPCGDGIELKSVPVTVTAWPCASATAFPPFVPIRA